MRILVTGASGFIGSGLVAALGEMGHEVSALMRSTASNENLKGAKFTRVTGDLSNLESLEKACENVEAVFHLAGLTVARNRSESFKFNAEGTRNLALAALKAGVKRFVYISSLAAAGPSPGLSPRTESEPDHPISTYGESKLRGELYLDELKGKLPFIVIRPPMVYGPRDKQIFLFFKTIQKQWMPIMPSKTTTGHKYYSAIHVDDLIQAMVRCLDLSPEAFARGERFFVNDGHVYTGEGILSLIAQEMKVKPIRIKIPPPLLGALALGGEALGKVLHKNLPFNRERYKEMAPDYWICSSQKAFDQLGFKPKHTMESGIPQTLAWYKMNGWL